MGFLAKLNDLQRDLAPPERWLFVAYDQLNADFGPLAGSSAGTVGIVLVETSWKPRLRPYHKQKLALLLTSQRHFALEQAAVGVPVRYVTTDRTYRAALQSLTDELGVLTMMEAAERELRVQLAPLVSSGRLEVVAHEGWLTSTEQFEQFAPEGDGTRWRMDRFYRGVRRATGVLMEQGKPLGGKYSHDAENRVPWKEQTSPTPPAPPTFTVDEVTEEVGALIESRFARHPGELDLAAIPASREQVDEFWQWAKGACMEHFGSYEDAMTVHSAGLFHTRIAPLMNLHRLLPQRILDDVLGLEIPLNSKEGFVRQVLGWREFVRHVHRATDGFRTLAQRTEDRPGDGGYGTWSGQEWIRETDSADLEGTGGAAFEGADVPPVFWGVASGLGCVDRVVADVWREGWSHHITRLMILSNLATLLEVSPRALADWFWVAYTDAYDWVVEPNVIGMGTYGALDVMTTKPYVSGSAYIHRMSDYCGSCTFDPKKNCPFARLYWAYLDRHRGESGFAGNRRLALPLRNVERRSAENKRLDQKTFETVRRRLEAGETLRPS